MAVCETCEGLRKTIDMLRESCGILTSERDRATAERDRLQRCVEEFETKVSVGFVTELQERVELLEQKLEALGAEAIQLCKRVSHAAN